MATFVSAAARRCQVFGMRRIDAALILLLLCVHITTDATAQGPSPTAPKPERYDIDVRFEPERSFLHARARVTFQLAEPTQFIEVELNRFLKILQITDGANRRLDFIRSGQFGSHKLSVRLAEPAPAEKPLVLTFVYEGPLPRGPLDYITKEGILLRDESRWYPATNLSAFTKNSVQIHLPDGWDGFASGQEPPDWASGQPSPELEWLKRQTVSSRAVVAWKKNESDCWKELAGTHPDMNPALAFCARANDKENWETMSKKTWKIIYHYGGMFKRYPLSILRVIQGFPGQRGTMGYSAPGFLVVSEDVVKYAGVPGWAPEFLPHEIAHQWFPIEVTLERQEDGWLAESLAEYLAWRFLRETDPPGAQLLVQRAMRDALEPEPLYPLALGLKLFAQEDFEVTYRTLYLRGMLVWRTLETVIDRSRVDLALREYYKRFRGRSASLADFRTICEEISGRNLGWFFDYFLNGTRIPKVSLRRLASNSPNEFAGEIMVENVPPDFQARVELRIRTAGGVVSHSVATSGMVTPFAVNLPAPALGVMLDPDLRILRWTEAARRNKQQWELLRAAAEEPEGTLATRAALEERLRLFTQILVLDADNLASNRQRFLFQRARLLYRLKRYPDALQEFNRVLEARFIEPMQAEFLRAWSRVYRARILRALGRSAEAAAEAKAGLALAAPALEEPIVWPEHPGAHTFARKELQKFVAGPAKKQK
jgi:tetratricopeptide (TPR) repeat protein